MTDIERLVDRLRDRVRDTVYEESSGEEDAYDAALGREEEAAQAIIEAFRATAPNTGGVPHTIGWCNATDLKAGDTYRTGGPTAGFEYTVLEVGDPYSRTPYPLEVIHIRVSRDGAAGEMTLGYYMGERVYRTSCAS